MVDGNEVEQAERWLRQQLENGMSPRDITEKLGVPGNSTIYAIAREWRKDGSIRVGRGALQRISPYLDKCEEEATARAEEVAPHTDSIGENETPIDVAPTASALIVAGQAPLGPVQLPDDIDAYDFDDPGYDEKWESRAEGGELGVADERRGMGPAGDDQENGEIHDAPEDEVGTDREDAPGNDGAKTVEGAEGERRQESETKERVRERVANLWVGEWESESNARRRHARELAVWQRDLILPLLAKARDAGSVLELTQVVASAWGDPLIAVHRKPSHGLSEVVEAEALLGGAEEVGATDPTRWWATQVETPPRTDADRQLDAARRQAVVSIATALLGGRTREVRVMEIVPLAAAVRFAQELCLLDLSAREPDGVRFNLLTAPHYLHGDALLVLTTGAEVAYQDPGAQLVGVAGPDDTLGLTAPVGHLRRGVSHKERQQRYVRPDHHDRPNMIGVRPAFVIPTVPYPDEDHFFGSPGWTDNSGRYWPGRHELIARMRHARTLYEDWHAIDRGNEWYYALYEAYVELELVLLHRNYAMTFERLIRGRASWPRSTREGFETRGRAIQVRANQGYAAAYRRRRTRSRVRKRIVSLLFGGALLSHTVCMMRLGSAAVRVGHASGTEDTRGMLTIREERVSTEGCGPVDNWRRRIFVGPRFSHLYDERDRQGWFTRIVSKRLYRKHAELDGSVCGLPGDQWYAVDPPMTPDYMTPHPKTGYIPSEWFHKRFRPHEYDSGYVPPEQEPVATPFWHRMRLPPSPLGWLNPTRWLQRKEPGAAPDEGTGKEAAPDL